MLIYLAMSHIMSKYDGVFDRVFESEGIHVIPMPVRVPNINAYAKQWVRTARKECLDHILTITKRICGTS